MARRKTEEEKIAMALAKVISDLRLDLDQIGIYLARGTPRVSQTRLEIITEAMIEETDKKYVRDTSNALWD